MKELFYTLESAFKALYLAIYQQQEKWNRISVRNWSEIMAKYER
jgi:transposase-like protein